MASIRRLSRPDADRLTPTGFDALYGLEQLLWHLVDSEGQELGFGVVAIRHGYEVGDRENELYAVGCLAVLDRIVRVTAGVYLVLGHGTRRFRLDRVDDTAGTPWTTGVVTWLSEEAGDESQVPALAKDVREVVQVRGVAGGGGGGEKTEEQ